MQGFPDFKKPTLAFQRLFVSLAGDNGQAMRDIEREVTGIYCERIVGERAYAPITLAALIGASTCRAIFAATEGVTVEGVKPTDRVKAVYLYLGVLDASGDAIAKIKTMGDVDFEGTVEVGACAEMDVRKKETGEGFVVSTDSLSNFAPANGFRGDESEFFAQVDQFAVVAPASITQDPDQNHDELIYESPFRLNVSTRRRSAAAVCNASEIRDAAALGKGVLIWPSKERHTDRYGFVRLNKETTDESAKVLLQHRNLHGHRGKLIAEVLETRDVSGVDGDAFRWIFSERPDVGELILLGTGTLLFDDEVTVGCKPDESRVIDWLNPTALYRAHWQTVRLYFVPTGS
jgi:hypothetical protein